MLTKYTGCYSVAGMKRHLVILSSFLCCYLPHSASNLYAEVEYDDIFDDGKEMEKKQIWKEGSYTIPPYPKKKNLLSVTIPESIPYKIYLDENSLSYADDNVVRYTIVIETTTGYQNIFYEGIRCTRTRYKTYAFANSEKVMTPIKSAKWQGISGQDTDFRHYLFRHYLCTENELPRTPLEIIRAINLPEEFH